MVFILAHRNWMIRSFALALSGIKLKNMETCTLPKFNPIGLAYTNPHLSA